MRLILFTLAGIATLLSGCTEHTNSGMITGTTPAPLLHGSIFPQRVHVEQPNGQAVRMDKVGGPFFILGFIAPPPGQPDYLSPDMQKLANRFSLDSVPVIQITIPTKASPLTDIPADQGRQPKDNFYRYYDVNGEAWEGFHRPPSGTLLVIDRWNLLPIIDARATIENPRAVIIQIRRLQDDWEDSSDGFSD